MAQKTNQTSSGNERPDTIEEALRVLDRALAGKSVTLNEMITAEFGNLKSAISGFTGGSRSDASDSSIKSEQSATEAMREIVDPYIQQATELSRRIDRKVRSNPWPLVGGVALGTFAIGFLLSGNSDYKSGRVGYDQ